MLTIDKKAVVRPIVLYRFSWFRLDPGDISAGRVQEFRRYACWQEDVSVDGEDYTAWPWIDAEIPEIASTREGEAKIIVRANADAMDPFKFIAYDRRPWGSIDVEIMEVDADDLTSFRTIFYGTVTKVIRNSSGRAGVVQIVAGNIFTFMRISLGLPAIATCLSAFGDKNCCVDVPSKREYGTIDQVDAFRLRIKNYSENDPRRYHRGYIDLVDGSGARLGIRDYDTPVSPGVGDFYFHYRFHPVLISYLLLQDVVLTPGCDKTFDGSNSCTYWNNTERFAGYGIVMKPYNPVTEIGGDDE